MRVVPTRTGIPVVQLPLSKKIMTLQKSPPDLSDDAMATARQKEASSKEGAAESDSAERNSSLMLTNRNRLNRRACFCYTKCQSRRKIEKLFSQQRLNGRSGL